MAEHMLTTVDNPWDPFTQQDEWLQHDESHGYYTLPLLARIIVTSDELSEADQSVAYEEAIEEIIKENVSGVHIRVTEGQFRKIL